MEVYFDKAVGKQLKKIPKTVKIRLELWIASINTVGLEETRKIPGYHDEPLKGLRQGEDRLG